MANTPQQPKYLCKVMYQECNHVFTRSLPNDPHDPNPFHAGKVEPGCCPACRRRSALEGKEDHSTWVLNVSREGTEAINVQIRAANARNAVQEAEARKQGKEIKRPAAKKIGEIESSPQGRPADAKTDRKNEILEWLLYEHRKKKHGRPDDSEDRGLQLRRFGSSRGK